MTSPILGKWFITKTLLAGEPDTNTRHLNFGDVTVITFNTNRQPWAKWKDEVVNRIARDFQLLEDNVEPTSKTPAAKARSGRARRKTPQS